MTKRVRWGTICAMILGAQFAGAQHSVTLAPYTANREVIAIDFGAVTRDLNLYPQIPWRIESSGITAQDDFLWSGPYGLYGTIPPGPYMHRYLLLNAHSSREYVRINGNLTQPGGPGGTPPWFRVTVPSVDIDWAGYESAADEDAEDTRKVYCPVTSDMSKRRKLVIRNPLDSGRVRDDSSLLGSNPTMELTLTSGSADCFLLRKADGSLFSTGSFRISSIQNWPLELYVEALPNKPPCELDIVLKGPGSGDERAVDRIKGSTIIAGELKSLEFTSDHKLLKKTPTTGSEWGDSSDAYEKPEWVRGVRKNPISQTKNTKLAVKLVLKMETAGVTFDLSGNGYDGWADFSKTGIASTGSDQTVIMTADDNLPDYVGMVCQIIGWKIKVGTTEYDIGSSGEHVIYETWGVPGVGLTLKRVDWACSIGQGADSVTVAAEKFRDAIAASPGYAANPDDNEFNLDAWQFLGSGCHGDCITLANLARVGLQTIGISADRCWSYPTADGTVGFPAVSGNSCRCVTTKVFQYQGESFNAKLVYPGNNFEGFFTVSDPGIKAYTVYTPGGPFANQTYYYLQVLNFAAETGGDQFWVWNYPDEPYSCTKNGVTVNDWEAVPNAVHIPVPAVP